VSFPFEWLTREHKLDAIYETLIANRSILMALQDQLAALTAEVSTLRGAVNTLQAAVDAEQEQVAAALALLTADNPDVAAAIEGLQDASAALGAATADVASTIPDAPPAEPTA